MKVKILIEEIEMSPDERHIKEHTENQLRHFYTHTSLCQSEESEHIIRIALYALLFDFHNFFGKIFTFIYIFVLSILRYFSLVVS